ncbi:MAG: FAD-binding protein, partial [Pseudomonadota bacterium]
LDLVARLNALTAERGGRIYLAKDAVMDAAAFAAAEPRAAAFRASAARDPAFATAQSHRLAL